MTDAQRSDSREATFPATQMAEYLNVLLHEEGDQIDAIGAVNPGPFGGFFVKRSGRRYYVRVEEVL